MPVVYTGHALQRMSFRGISKEKVEETLEKPDMISDGRENKKIAFKKFREGIIEVVFCEENKELIVISVRWS